MDFMFLNKARVPFSLLDKYVWGGGEEGVFFFFFPFYGFD